MKTVQQITISVEELQRTLEDVIRQEISQRKAANDIELYPPDETLQAME